MIDAEGISYAHIQTGITGPYTKRDVFGSFESPLVMGMHMVHTIVAHSSSAGKALQLKRKTHSCFGTRYMDPRLYHRSTLLSRPCFCSLSNRQPTVGYLEIESIMTLLHKQTYHPASMSHTLGLFRGHTTLYETCNAHNR